MGKLIDADKLLEWLEREEMKNYWMKDAEGAAKARVLSALSREVIEGTFDPDPIPLPTIKPGDKVVITDAMNPDFIGTKAIVENISASSPYSAKLKGIHGDWPLSSLEVSHE